MIEISRDQMYKLIQELKELRHAINKDSYKGMLKRHSLKVQYLLLDSILKNGGIHKLVYHTKQEKDKLRLFQEVAVEENKEQ